MSELISLHPGVGAARGGTSKLFAVILLQIGIIVLLFTLPNPVITIGVLLTLLCGTIILVDPRAIVLTITVVTFVFHAEVLGHGYVVRILGVNWYAMDWILFFGVLAWLIRWAYGLNPPLQKTVLVVPMTIYLLSLPFFAGFSALQGNLFQDAFADMRPFFYYISFFAVLLYAREWKDLEMIFWVMIVCGTVGAIPEIIGSLSHSSFDTLAGRKLSFVRISGAHEVNYPLQLVSSLSMLPFVRSWGKRLLILVSILVSTAALYLSYTRGSWLAVLVGGGVTLFVLLRYGSFPKVYLVRIIRAILVLFAAAILLIVVGMFDAQTLLTRATMTSSRSIDISSLQRVTEWQLAIKIFLSHPVFGGGLGYIYRFYAVGVGELKQMFLHNSYLYVLSKMGIVGFSIFAFLYSMIVWKITLILKKLRSPDEIGLLTAFASMIFVLLVKSLTTWFLNTLTTSLFLGVIIGVIGVIDAWVTPTSSENSGLRRPIV